MVQDHVAQLNSSFHFVLTVQPKLQDTDACLSPAALPVFIAVSLLALSGMVTGRTFLLLAFCSE